MGPGGKKKLTRELKLKCANCCYCFENKSFFAFTVYLGPSYTTKEEAASLHLMCLHQIVFSQNVFGRNIKSSLVKTSLDETSNHL